MLAYSSKLYIRKPVGNYTPRPLHFRYAIMVQFIKYRLPELLAALLILLFVYTAVSKLLSFRRFQTVLSYSPLIGRYSKALAYTIPGVELLVAALLFLPQTRTKGFAGSILLMAAFTGYIAYMLLFEPHLPCSCGGVISSMNWTGHLLFNLVFTLVAWIGYRESKKQGARLPPYITKQ
jgi:putative oxidoreductase